MSWTSCDDSTSAASTSQVFRILPRSGITAWNSRSRACLAEPPAESPSTRNSSARFGSWLLQSASLPGSAGPATTRLRAIFWLAFNRVWALTIASWAIFSPASGCWLEPQPELVLDDAGDERRGFARRQAFLGLPGELRVAHLHREHVAGVVPDVLGRRASGRAAAGCGTRRTHARPRSGRGGNR